jgi:hypothetical protein
VIADNSAAPLGNTEGSLGGLDHDSLSEVFLLNDWLDRVDQLVSHVVFLVGLQQLEESGVQQLRLACGPVVWNFALSVGAGNHLWLLEKEEAESLGEQLHWWSSSLKALQLSHITTAQALHSLDGTFVDGSDLLQSELALSVFGLGKRLLLLGRVFFDLTLSDSGIDNLLLGLDFLLHLGGVGSLDLQNWNQSSKLLLELSDGSSGIGELLKTSLELADVAVDLGSLLVQHTRESLD